MPTKKPKSDENTAAAHSFLSEASDKIGRHADTMKARIEELTEERDELKDALSKAEAAREREVAALAGKLEREQAEHKGTRQAFADMKARVLGHIQS